MDNLETSENNEAVIVLVGSLTGAATAFLAALPIPIEWKAPIVALGTAVSTAIFTYWKMKVNKKA